MKKSAPKSIQNISVYIRRWFDKVNGNSYFNYYISISNGMDRIIYPAKYNLSYGYGSYPMQTAREHIIELGYDLSLCNIQEFDVGYGLKRDMKNLTDGMLPEKTKSKK